VTWVAWGWHAWWLLLLLLRECAGWGQLRDGDASHDGADVQAGCVYCCPLGVISLVYGDGRERQPKRRELM
jgi:hypothetical protein